MGWGVSAMIGSHYPVARKPHACGYCGQDIPKGQRYHRWAWVADGRCSTVVAHIACDAVAQDHYNGSGCYDDERWVDAQPLREWATDGDVVGRLCSLAGRTAGWPIGEVNRLAKWMGVAP